MKNERSSKRFLLGFVLLIVVLLLLFSYQKTILIEAGNYLAPEGISKADVLIVEGGMLIKLNAVKIGLNLIFSQWANCLVVVDQDVEGEDIFALSEYPQLVAKNLEALGLKRGQFEIIGVPAKHPITLTEAKTVLSHLSKKGVRSAILLTQGFHARRSYWSYKQVGLPLGIKIIPHPYFINYRKENWWQRVDGVNEFFNESLKFVYYVLRGYIPFKSVFVT